MRLISARFVPRPLSDDQKALRVSVCRELKQEARDDPNFISSIITGDETWVYGYDLEAKQQSSQWKSPNSPRPKEARQVRSNVKSMLVFFFFLTSKTLSTKNSSPLVKPLMVSFTVRFRSGWGTAFGANVQTSEEKQLIFPPWQCVRSYITRCSTISDIQKHYSFSPPPYSPDLAPYDVSLFLKMKLWLKWRRFDTAEEIHAESQDVIDTLTFENFQGAWNHEKHAGIAVYLYMPKWTTSKEMVKTRSYGTKLIYGLIPRIFG